MDHRSILITIVPHCSAASFTLLLSNDATRTVLFLDSDPYWPWSTTRSYARMLWFFTGAVFGKGLYTCLRFPINTQISPRIPPLQKPPDPYLPSGLVTATLGDSFLVPLSTSYSTLRYCILGGMLAPTPPSTQVHCSFILLCLVCIQGA